MKNSETSTYLNPYLAGFLLGLTLLASYAILGAGLGASNGLARLTSWCVMQINSEHVLQSEYFGGWGENPLKYYLVYMFAGIFVGGFASAMANGRVKVQTERGASFPAAKRLLLALFGGLLAGFASRLARGCTSGIGLSGTALLTTGGFAFLIATFAGGYAAAWFFRGQWHD